MYILLSYDVKLLRSNAAYCENEKVSVKNSSLVNVHCVIVKLLIQVGNVHEYILV